MRNNKLPLFALIGRPNVGKSSIFNSLSQKQKSIVSKQAYATRDINVSEGYLLGSAFNIADTPGIETKLAEDATYADDILANADLIGFIVDSAGITPIDMHIASMLRKHYNDKVILIINKSDRSHEKSYSSFGFKGPIYISAKCKYGYEDLHEALNKYMNLLEDKKEGEELIHMSIIGRPNAGKSTLVNNILGESRMRVSEVAGTTRDSIYEMFEYEDQKFCIIDTAGIRKKTKVKEEIEQLSVSYAISAIRNSNICVLLIDALNLLDRQDLKIASMAIEQGRALIIAINKIDMISRKHMDEFKATTIKQICSKMPSAEVIFISAIKKFASKKLLNTISDIHERAVRKISTSALNKWLKKTTSIHKPPYGVSLKYAVQTGVFPSMIKIFCNKAENITAYERYLKNSFIKDFNLQGVVVDIIFVAKSDSKD